MNQRPLQIVAIGISGLTAAGTAITLALYMWPPPAFSINLELPFVLANATFIGFLLLSATFLANSSKVTSEAHGVQPPATITPPQPSVLYRLNYVTPELHGNILERLYGTSTSIQNVKAILEARGWREISEVANRTNAEIPVIDIRLVLLVGARYDGHHVEAHPNDLWLFFREPASTSFTTRENEWMCNCIDPRANNQTHFYFETHDSFERFIRIIATKEQEVTSRLPRTESPDNLNTFSPIINTTPGMLLSNSARPSDEHGRHT